MTPAISKERGEATGLTTIFVKLSPEPQAVGSPRAKFKGLGIKSKGVWSCWLFLVISSLQGKGHVTVQVSLLKISKISKQLLAEVLQSVIHIQTMKMCPEINHICSWTATVEWAALLGAKMNGSALSAKKWVKDYWERLVEWLEEHNSTCLTHPFKPLLIVGFLDSLK